MLMSSLFFLVKKIFSHMLNLLPLYELKVVSSVDGDLRYAHGCTSQAKPFWWSCQMVLYSGCGGGPESSAGAQYLVWVPTSTAHCFCSLFKPSLRGWHLTDHKIESSAQELPPPHNPNNANILLAPVCPPSSLLRQFLRLSFQNPACLSSLARGVSSSGLDALCCTQKMPHRWTLSPTH